MTRLTYSLFLGLALLSSLHASEDWLKPAPAPADNPLKGLVPYVGQWQERFPHSMEFCYLSLAELMKGPETYDWAPLELKLEEVSGRGHHLIFRVWLEYPGKEDGIPAYLIQDGLKVIRWENEGTVSLSPDYRNGRLITALERFIAAMGKRYDGDPRIGYITAGLLGSWGEWHSYPREDLFASVKVQERVMAAYERHFEKTPILLRYPAGETQDELAPNAERPFGYHDDSFAWGTLFEEGSTDSWFYMAKLRDAGPAALTKWQTQPIGGEIRPELWGIIFDKKPAHPKAQDFAECVRQTHVTWLMDTGMFREKAAPKRMQRAVEQVRKMGYTFQLRSAKVEQKGERWELDLEVVNQGVAPFYQDWRIEVAALDAKGEIKKNWPVDWKLTGILPGETKRWKTSLKVPQSLENSVLALRVVNPLPKGQPLRFGNVGQDQHREGWVSFGELRK